METAPAAPSSTATRRAVLGSTVGAIGMLTGGCLQRARSVIGRQPGEQVSLTIKTVPADEDRSATEIARRLATHLDAVGIDSEVVLMREDELQRDVLINNDFDVYVARYPAAHDPDFLRPLLHSRFNGEPGWQNPFGFTDLHLDELLDDQRRRSGDDRQSVVYETQREFTRQQPFTVLGFPDEVRTARTDRFQGWSASSLRSPLSFLRLRRAGVSTGSEQGDEESGSQRLRVAIRDVRVTKNLNPIAVEFRNRGTFTGLLYDSLGRRYDGAVRPWLARDWSWGTNREGVTATVRLRDDLRWHDGTDLTAADVAFTYRFLADTTLGERESPVPAPRFRGRTSLIESIDALDDRTLRIELGETTPEVAVRAFTVPVLPAHEWRPKAREEEIAGIDLFDGVTEALVWDNPDPIGSGVLRFDRSISEELLALDRFEDHFLNRDPPEELEQRFGGLAFQELVARVAPSDAAAVELIDAGEVDATASSLDPSVVPRIGRSDELQLLVAPSPSFYHVGFNARSEPLSNQRFRRAVARLIDKRYVTDDIFGGYLRPAATPVSDREWTPSDLRWEGSDPEVPFVGTRGELDEAEARELFRDAGFQYNDNGRLLTR